MIVQLTVGDWSDDGHGKTDDINYEINCTKSELQHAHDIGCEIVGGNMDNECEDYECCELTDKFVSQLAAVGIVAEKCQDSDTFAELFMQIARLGNPDLTWQRVPANSICIGGYGLFV